jgi:hypothetical protein
LQKAATYAAECRALFLLGLPEGVRGTVPLTTIGTKADRRTTPDTSAKLTEEPSLRYVGKADKRTVPLTEDTEKVSNEPSP